MRRRPTRDEQLGQRRQHIIALGLACHGQRRALPACLVNDRQDSVFATVMGAAFDEVVGPDMARILGSKPDARSVVQPEPPALRLPLRHFEPLAAPDTLNPPAVHMPPRIAQQRRHPPIAIATILPRQRHDILGESRFVICPARRLALRRSVLAEHTAQPPLGHRHHRSDVVDIAPPPRGARKFPRTASCRISLSSVRSDIARRSRAFFFSRSFIRRAWSVFRPPYSLRQR